MTKAEQREHNNDYIIWVVTRGFFFLLSVCLLVMLIHYLVTRF